MLERMPVWLNKLYSVLVNNGYRFRDLASRENSGVASGQLVSLLSFIHVECVKILVP